MIYDQAVYDILFYNADLAAYRTDRFTGWQNQPLANGKPLFTYGTLQYTLLKDATAQPSPTAAPTAAPSGAPTTAPTPAPSGDGGTGSGGDLTVTYALFIGAIIVVVGVVLAFIFRRRSARAAGDEE
jgi:hypothetical protein